MGPDDLRRRPPLLSVVDRLRAGHRHPDRRARLQLPRRRPARLSSTRGRSDDRQRSRCAPARGPRPRSHLRYGPAAALEAVRGIDLDVQRGEMLGMVGESGSGKSVTMLAVMGLLPPSRPWSRDRSRFRGEELLGMAPKALPGDPRRTHRHDLSGPADRAQSGADRRRADRRGDPHPRSRRISRKAAMARAVDLLDLVVDPAARERRARSTRTSSPAACGSG